MIGASRNKKDIEIQTCDKSGEEVGNTHGRAKEQPCPFKVIAAIREKTSCLKREENV